MIPIAVSLIVAALSFHLFKKAAGTMDVRQINLISLVFYYDLVTMSLFASVMVLNNWAQSYTLSFLFFEKTDYYVWLSVLYVMVAMPVAMIVTCRILNVKSVNSLLERYFRQPVAGLFDKHAHCELPLLLAFSVISCISVIYTLMSTESIPILEMIRGASPDQLALMRVQAKREFSGIGQFSTIFGTLLGPILLYVSYIYYKKERKKAFLIWFLIMLLFTSTMLFYHLAKAPIIKLFIGFLSIQVMLKKRIRLRKQIVFISLLLISTVFLFKVTKGIDETRMALSGVFERITITQLEGVYHMYEIFPGNHEFIKGRSISQVLSAILKYDYIEPAERIAMKEIYPTAVAEGRVGTMSTLFIGDAWANFGLIGVLISPLIVGAWLLVIYVFILKNSKSPLILGFYGFITSHNYIQGGFMNGIIFNSGLLSIILILFCIGVAARFVNHSKKASRYIAVAPHR